MEYYFGYIQNNYPVNQNLRFPACVSSGQCIRPIRPTVNVQIPSNQYFATSDNVVIRSVSSESILKGRIGLQRNGNSNSSQLLYGRTTGPRYGPSNVSPSSYRGFICPTVNEQILRNYVGSGSSSGSFLNSNNSLPINGNSNSSQLLNGQTIGPQCKPNNDNPLQFSSTSTNNLQNNNKQVQLNNEKARETKVSINGIINIIPFKVRKEDKCLSDDDNIYEILYTYCRGKSTSTPGSDSASKKFKALLVNFEKVKEMYPNISSLRMKCLDYSTKLEILALPDIDIKKGDKCDISVITNKYNKYIIQLSFMDEEEEKLRVHIKLKCEKTQQREGEEKYGKGKKPKGFYKNQNKIERIEKLLVIEKEKGWKLFKLFEECPKIVSEFKKKSNFKNITNIEKMENAKDIINVIINNSNIDQKNSDVINNNDIDNKKNNLLILCFDLIYKCIINNNADEGMKKYLYRNHKDFIKNYNIGHSRENDIVIIDEETKEKNEEENNEKINKEENNEKNEEDKNEMELRNNNKQYKKRKCPEEKYSIELDEKRPRIDKCSGDSSKQTNKNSDSEVLLVDRFLS